ncbi:MAG: EamA family transporter [Saprospiraceae bacterium]
MSNRFKAHTALFFTALIYGANFTVAKEILDHDYVHPFALTLMRVLAGFLLFSLFHYFFIKEKIERKDIRLFVLCALTGVATNQLLFITGLKYTTHINAALIMTTTPILVLVASSLILKEAVTLKKMLGIGLGIAGAAILTLYGKKFAFQKEGLLGDIMVFVNAVSYGTYLVLVKSLMVKYHPLTVTKWVFSFGLLFVLPFGYHELANTPMNIFTPRIWMAIAYVLICTTFLAYLLNAFALKLVNPSTVSIYIYLQPLIATAIALSFGKDELNLTKVAAGMLIFSGVFLVSKK